jgi:hypothetical protein
VAGFEPATPTIPFPKIPENMTRRRRLSGRRPGGHARPCTPGCALFI